MTDVTVFTEPQDAGTGTIIPATPKITDDSAYEKLPSGSTFLDPEGKTRKKPWTVKSDKDFDAVPEGETFLDPAGSTRKKPKYEGVDFTTQTLYDMSLTDKERRNALERSYPGKVKAGEGTGELYVEDEDGVLRKPGRGGLAGRVGAGAASMAAPVAGSVLGAIGAGPMGAVGGGIGGQMVNDLLLGLAGVYDRSVVEEASNLGIAGGSSIAGYGVGKGIGAMAPSLKAGVQAGTQAIPRAAAHFLGVEKEGLELAKAIAEKGERPGTGILGKVGISETDRPVAPSVYAKEAPHLQLEAEVFDPAFNTGRALRKGAEEHYESEAGKILDDLGVKPEGKLTDPTAAVSSQRAGDAVLAKVHGEMQVADAKMKTALDEARTASLAGKETKTADYAEKMKNLRDAAAQDRKAAQNVIDETFKVLQEGVDQAMHTAKAHGNTGELWAKIGERFQQARAAIVKRHENWYAQADQAAAGHIPDSRGLPELAERMLGEMPGDFEKKYPTAVKMLKDLAGVQNEKGEFIKAPVTPSFGQLHNLRSYFRNNVRWYDLPSDFQNGTYKFLAKHVDDVLHDPKAAPELQTAAHLLDATDRSYSQNIKIFNDSRLGAVVKGLESGQPADPKLLFDTLVKEGRSDLIREVEKMVGPNLWAGVRAADVQEMLDAAKSLVPGQIDGGAFAREVLKRERANMLKAVHGNEMTEKLLKQAQNISMLDGKLDIAVRPGDTITEIIGKARASADTVKVEAKADPLGVLNREMKTIEREHNQQVSKMKAERKNDPLGFLYDLKLGASDAAHTILQSEDLILASAARFGEKSPEFNALRQVWVHRLLQGTLEPSKKLEKISPEIQQIMFPGVTLKQMRVLAKEMDAMMSSSGAGEHTGTAGSMSAIARVENPWSHIAGGKGGVVAQAAATALKITTLGMASGPAGRGILGMYYDFIRRLATSPSTLRFLEKGLEGGPIEQEAARRLIRQGMKRGGAIGAGAGEAAYQQ